MNNEKGQFVKGTIPWNKGLKGVMNPWNKGMKCPEISLRQIGDKNHAFGSPSWNSGTKGIMKPNKTSFKKGASPWIKGRKHTEETLNKIKDTKKKHFPDGQTAWNKGINQWQTTGDKNPNWNGGVTPEYQRIRHSLEMKLWRKACMERDKFTCQKTGENGGRLNVHHINNFSDFSELRTSIENGITLSKEVHKHFHSIYGNKNNNRVQLDEFLTNN